MTTVENCATGTLAPYVPSNEVPWNRQRIQHLYRRLRFGATLPELLLVAENDPQVAVDTLIDDAVAAPATPAPAWSNWSFQDYGTIDDFNEIREQQLIEWYTAWMTDLIEHPVRAKLLLFWHDHFVTELITYDCPSWFYDYYHTLETHALGNFKTFVSAIGLAPAMLYYLNGAQNSTLSPNENYARELYELFTLGADNGYTQEDIEETSRALTGYTTFSDYCGTITFNAEDHDTQPKTIFGQTGNWGYQDVIDILFEQRSEEIATHICGKLYQHFVHPEINEAIVSGLAATFQENDWEVVPVLKQLFKSEHFYDEGVLNVLIKTPIDHILGFANELGLPIAEDQKIQYLEFAAYIGQYLGNPPSVAGWTGNRSWIATSLLTARWQVNAGQTLHLYQSNPEAYRDFAFSLVDNPAVSDPYIVTEAIVDFFIPGGLTDSTQYDRANIVFKGDVPQNYFDLGLWNLNFEAAPAQVALLISYIGRMPEFQIM